MKKLILSALAVAATIGSASAQTEITVTGATAFRDAAVNAILAAYQSTGNVNHAYSGASFGGANRHYFIGEFPGIAGTTIVRTSWSGSVEGVRDVVEENAVPVIETPTSVSPTGVSGQAEDSGSRVANLAFSDVVPAQTPYSSTGLTSLDAGVIAFVMVANEGAPAQWTNVTQQQYKALASEGELPLSIFTGLDTDDDVFVLNTGRNDGSGTRTVYLAESGYGYTGLVQQYKEISNSGDAITEVRRWPVGDGVNASTVWNADTAGNGGYSSGSALRSVLGRTSASVDLTLADGSPLADDLQVYLLSSVGLSDARSAKNLGAKPLAYNGVSITPVDIGSVDGGTNTGYLSAADKAKIANGQYSLWSFEQFMYDNTDNTASELTFFNAVRNAIQLQVSIGTSGMTLTEMGTTRRAAAGAVIFPLD